MMADIVFRTCTERDLPAVQGLVEQLYAGLRGAVPVHTDISLTYRELTGKPDKGRVIVFESAGRLIGYGIIIFFWSNEYSGDVIEIDELFVAEDRRSLGAATQFFSWLFSTFGARSSGFALQVSRKNLDALRLYKRLGFSESPNLHLLRIDSLMRDD